LIIITLVMYILYQFMCHKWPLVCSTNDHGCAPQMTTGVLHKWPLVCSTNDHGCAPLIISTLRFLSCLWLVTGFVSRVTCLPFHNSTQVFSGVHVAGSLVVLAVLVDRCVSFFFLPSCCLSFFDVYGFWLLHTPFYTRAFM
jgi:hypothetical protein